MKTNSNAWVIPGVLSALLLVACGGGGGGGGSAGTAVPSLTITAVNTETAVVKLDTNSAIPEVQLLISTVEILSGDNATSEDAAATRSRGILLYNSAEGVASLPTIAASGNLVFGLTNVSFAAAGSDPKVSASAIPCSSNVDALGTVRLEVFSQGVQLVERDVPVCSIQGTSRSAPYTVTL